MPLQHHPVLSRRPKRVYKNVTNSDLDPGLLIDNKRKALLSLQESKVSLVTVVSSDNDASSETYLDVKDLFRDLVNLSFDVRLTTTSISKTPDSKICILEWQI